MVRERARAFAHHTPKRADGCANALVLRRLLRRGRDVPSPHFVGSPLRQGSSPDTPCLKSLRQCKPLMNSVLCRLRRSSRTTLRPQHTPSIRTRLYQSCYLLYPLKLPSLPSIDTVPIPRKSPSLPFLPLCYTLLYLSLPCCVTQVLPSLSLPPPSLSQARPFLALL